MNLASGAIAHSKPVERRSITTTSSPPSSRRQTMWLPMYPPPPVTSIVIAAFELPASFVGLLEGLRSELNWNPDAWLPQNNGAVTQPRATTRTKPLCLIGDSALLVSPLPGRQAT